MEQVPLQIADLNNWSLELYGFMIKLTSFHNYRCSCGKYAVEHVAAKCHTNYQVDCKPGIYFIYQFLDFQ